MSAAASSSSSSSSSSISSSGLATPGTPSPKSSSAGSAFTIGPLPPASAADADLSAFQFADVPDFADSQSLSFSSFPPQLLPPEYKQHYDAAVSAPLDSDALFSAPGPVRSVRSRASLAVNAGPAAAAAAANASNAAAAASVKKELAPEPRLSIAPVLVAVPPASASLSSSSSSSSFVDVASPVSEDSPTPVDADDDSTSDAYKKELHRNTERQRRQKTNDAMNSLRRLIGNKYKKKLAILTETIRQFQSMQSELKQVTAENQQLRARMDKSRDVKVDVVGVPSVDWGAVFLRNDIASALCSLDMKFIAVNQAFVAKTGHALTADLTWQSLTPPGQMAEVYSVMAALLRGDTSAVVTKERQMIVTASGDSAPCKVVYSLVRATSNTQPNTILMQLFPL